MRKRAASHAGSWYENNPQTLARQLTGWLEKERLRTPWLAIFDFHIYGS